MLAEPRDLDRGALKAVLERHWGLSDPELEYLPVGFGSHHWAATDSHGVRWFVSVDDLDAPFQAGPDRDGSFDLLERAYKVAACLHDEAGLEFVVAPLRDDEGRVTRRVTDRYAVNVCPFLTGDTQQFGRYVTNTERREMATLLGRLHTATVPADLPRKEDFALPARAQLEDALADLDSKWGFGPFAQPTRELLQATGNIVMRRLQMYDDLVASVSASPEPWVVTHGEPHRANTIRIANAVHLIDWDTTLLAPRERDLRWVVDTQAAGDLTLNAEALQLYDLWWELCDISIFVALFREFHEEDEQTAASWENLRRSLTLYT